MRTHARIALLLLGAVGIAAHGIAAEKDYAGIENLMPREQFQGAGLDKLTPAELQVLNDWLAGNAAKPAPAVAARGETLEDRRRDNARPIEARVLPPFDGWSGDTIFELDNGQAWRQRMQGRYRFEGDDTDVVIKQNVFGFYIMTLKATGRSIGVAQIR